MPARRTRLASAGNTAAAAAAAAAALLASISVTPRAEVWRSVDSRRRARKAAAAQTEAAAAPSPYTPARQPTGRTASHSLQATPPSPPTIGSAANDHDDDDASLDSLDLSSPPPLGLPSAAPADLPTDVLLALLAPLSFHDRVACQAVCTRWRDVLSTDDGGAGAWPVVVVDANALAAAGRREAARAAAGGGWGGRLAAADPSGEEEDGDDDGELESEDDDEDDARAATGPPWPGGGQGTGRASPTPYSTSDRPEARVARWIARRAPGIDRVLVRGRIPRGPGADAARADLERTLAAVAGAAAARRIPVDLAVRGESPWGGGGGGGAAGGVAAPAAGPAAPGGGLADLHPPPGRALAWGGLPALLGPALASIRMRGVCGPVSRAQFADLCALGAPGLVDLEIAAAGDEEGEGLLEVTPDLGRLVRLTRLKIEANDGVDGLPAALGSLTALRVLSIAMCPVSVLPAELTRCTALTALSLTWNAPGAGPDLPPDLTPLSSLRRVDLSDCSLRRAPAALATLPALAALDLSGNTLLSPDWWPVAFGRASATLAVLRCIDTQISALPPHLGACPLVTLDVSECRLAELPLDLGRAGRTLQALRVRGNRLTSVPALLGALPALVEADLSFQTGGSFQVTLPLAAAVRGCPHLRRLDLRQAGAQAAGGAGTEGGGRERGGERGGAGRGGGAAAQPAAPAAPGGWTAASLFLLAEADALLETRRRPRPVFLY